jgi:LuxR family maltose regulon positive regulatory protein
MISKTHSIPIFHAKLHRPPVARDFMRREALDALLDQSPAHALTLVSAPAGCGKSSAVNHWLETRDVQSAWLSLDATDSDITMFLTYLVAAVQTLFPEACTETQSWINSSLFKQFLRI